MHHFSLRDGELYCESVPLARIAEREGTPLYVYSRATLERPVVKCCLIDRLRRPKSLLSANAGALRARRGRANRSGQQPWITSTVNWS